MSSVGSTPTRFRHLFSTSYGLASDSLSALTPVFSPTVIKRDNPSCLPPLPQTPASRWTRNYDTQRHRVHFRVTTGLASSSDSVLDSSWQKYLCRTSLRRFEPGLPGDGLLCSGLFRDRTPHGLSIKSSAAQAGRRIVVLLRPELPLLARNCERLRSRLRQVSLRHRVLRLEARGVYGKPFGAFLDPSSPGVTGSAGARNDLTQRCRG